MSFGSTTGFGFGQSNNQSSGTGFGGFGNNTAATNTGMLHSPLTICASTWSPTGFFVQRGLASGYSKSSSNTSLRQCRIWRQHKQYWLWKHDCFLKPFQHQRIRHKYGRYVGRSRNLASIMCWPPCLSQGCLPLVSLHLVSSLLRYTLKHS